MAAKLCKIKRTRLKWIHEAHSLNDSPPASGNGCQVQLRVHCRPSYLQKTDCLLLLLALDIQLQLCLLRPGLELCLDLRR